MPLVSILTPTYQHEPYIAQCIRSVLSQSFSDWELIIVDDGSHDHTPDIAESFGDSRITVVRRPHTGPSGLGEAYAAALARGSSPLLAILEGDDTWPDNKLERQIPLLDDPGVVLSYGDAGLIDAYGCQYSLHKHAPCGQRANNDPIGSILPSLIGINFIVAATVLIRRSALEQVGGFFQPVGIPYVDHPTWLRLATVGRFARSHDVLGFWRRHTRQITTQQWLNAPLDRSAYLDEILHEARVLLSSSLYTPLASLIARDQARQASEVLIARGRLALLAGHWSEALSIFRGLLRGHDNLTLAIGCVGTLCALTHTDMESFIALCGRHSLPPRRHMHTHDR